MTSQARLQFRRRAPTAPAVRPALSSSSANCSPLHLGSAARDQRVIPPYPNAIDRGRRNPNIIAKMERRAVRPGRSFQCPVKIGRLGKKEQQRGTTPGRCVWKESRFAGNAAVGLREFLAGAWSVFPAHPAGYRTRSRTMGQSTDRRPAMVPGTDAAGQSLYIMLRRGGCV